MGVRAQVEKLSDAQIDPERLYREHQPRVLRLCRLLLADVQEAQEVAQEVFLKALEQHRAGNAPRQWAPWLTRVTINACHDRRRSGWWKWWRRRVEEFMEVEHAAAPGRGIEDAAASRERCAQLWCYFRKLPKRQREVFVLRYVEEHSTQQVAEMLELSPGTVKRHLFRAVQQLRRAIGERS